uniref:Uncharacterized protein n=1 Tax=viral metagenome TaxID=1070528 RepID=A0A6C0I8V6_9ZZZZ
MDSIEFDQVNKNYAKFKENIEIELTDTLVLKEYNDYTIIIKYRNDSFFENLKTDLIKALIPILKKTKVCLQEFYCDPYNSGELKLINSSLVKGTVFSGKLVISGVWLAEKSFGPYIKVINEQINNNHLFLDIDSD